MPSCLFTKTHRADGPIKLMSKNGNGRWSGVVFVCVCVCVRWMTISPSLCVCVCVCVCFGGMQDRWWNIKVCLHFLGVCLIKSPGVCFIWYWSIRPSALSQEYGCHAHTLHIVSLTAGNRSETLHKASTPLCLSRNTFPLRLVCFIDSSAI